MFACLFYWLPYLPPKQTLSHQNLCTSSIEDTKYCVQITGSYLTQKVRYWYLEKYNITDIVAILLKSVTDS